MTDPINKEINIAIINESNPNTKENKNSKQNISHNNIAIQSLDKKIKADGHLSYPGKTIIQSYYYKKYTNSVCNEIKSIELAIKDNCNIIVSSNNSYYFNDDEGQYFLSRAFSTLVSYYSKEALIFFNFGNNKNGLFGNNAHNYYKVNNHRTIPVGSIYYKKELEQVRQSLKSKNSKEKVKRISPPGANVFISDRGFNFENSIASNIPCATFHVAGSAGVIAYRHLKPRTQGDFPTLTKKYLGYSARHINQNELLDGWATENLSQYMRNIEFNKAEDCNFGQGLGFSYEHGTGEYDPVAFSHLCQSHLPEFDVKVLKDSEPHKTLLKPISDKNINQIAFAFDCEGHKGYIDGAYFSFQKLEEVNITEITLESPDGTKSHFVSQPTSLRTSIMKNKPPNEKILYLRENTERSYVSNRHFGEKAKKGQWIATIKTHWLIPFDEEKLFALEFKLFDQKNKNMIINNNIFHSDKTLFTYQNDEDVLDYFNLSPTSSENVVNLKERKATLTYTHPHPKIRTTDDLEAYGKSLQEPVTPKVVDVIIDANTLVEYVADGSGNGTLIGNEVSNKLLGLSGDDTLHGEEGDDHLYPGRANHADKGYGGIGDDTHYVCSYEPGHYWAHDDTAGNNSIVFNISYKENIERSIDKVTKEISYKVDYTPLTLNNVKFFKNSNTEYWMQGGNKKVRFDPAEIQSVVLKHELTGKTKTYDRKAIDILCSG